MDSVLLVEDKAELREMLTHALKRMNFAPVPAANVEEALHALRGRRFAAVLTDLKLPAGSGLNVLAAALEADPDLPVIIMTAHGTIPDAVAAMREGAYDFIQKPIDLAHLQHLLTRAIERGQLRRDNIVLKEEYARTLGLPRIIGDSPAMRAVARELQRLAPAESAVLLLGESGTGKELFARAIHQLSPRAARPMVSINCAAIPESLIENELFGHERGAFTGADSRRPGKFELAHGGTIFLDEVGELPLNAQAKLLRVLEEKVVERLGGTAPIPTDVRLVAAMTRVVPIRIPPLRDRGDDVEAVEEVLAELLAADSGLEVTRVRCRRSPPARSNPSSAPRSKLRSGNVSGISQKRRDASASPTRRYSPRSTPTASTARPSPRRPAPRAALAPASCGASCGRSGMCTIARW